MLHLEADSQQSTTDHEETSESFMMRRLLDSNSEQKVGDVARQTVRPEHGGDAESKAASVREARTGRVEGEDPGRSSKVLTWFDPIGADDARAEARGGGGRGEPGHGRCGDWPAEVAAGYHTDVTSPGPTGSTRGSPPSADETGVWEKKKYKTQARTPTKSKPCKSARMRNSIH